ncbi:hypothetical protein AVEN_209972-1 [Araneus ventricosus]|uniref:Uncharacterized protein n=1 Tax=Araneus ventricosus TaxID=182803 RepID=A0A4Y2DDC7_ARAVE|nr:hypothetical protein AVEN_209972-1 [Araneus ventricosus]
MMEERYAKVVTDDRVNAPPLAVIDARSGTMLFAVCMDIDVYDASGNIVHIAGRKIYNILPSVTLRQTNWIRVDVIFFSQHGPFPAFLKRFHLSDSDYCSCGGIGTALHYATECIYTVSWHMRKPAPNFEQEWLKRVANNLVSRQKIRGIIKFMSGNRDLFRPPYPSTFKRAELSSSITGHSPFK